MPAGNIEIVRALYEAMNEQDLPRARELTHPEAEWISDPRLGMEPLRGREAIFGFFMDQAEMFEGLRVEVERLTEAGDKVLALIRVTGQGQASGAAVDISIGHVWTIRDAVAIRGEGYGDRDEALQAAGLADRG
jgi:ketosteroid isomerase-like protein